MCLICNGIKYEIEKDNSTLTARKRHPYDGSYDAGRPISPEFKISEYARHKPVDGESTCYTLVDGYFLHNLQVYKKRTEIIY